MLFPSEEFLWVFLPIVIIIYFGLFRRSTLGKNVFLLLSSLFFYAWGEPIYVGLMISVIVISFFLALAIENTTGIGPRLFLIVDIVSNLCFLFIFKYSYFFLSQSNRFLHTDFPLHQVALPIGISFFTFQALSYVIDVYRGQVKAQRNLLYLGLYISFFPQLIAGPIVRYETIERQLTNRKESVAGAYEGACRFIIGLCKKVIIANNLARIADAAFELIGGDIYYGAVSMAYLGAISYTLQIYFDFSGYSDMAIGLGKIFGFEFPENFNYPYMASSVTEFWHRWHISLSSFFRDYVYIPLGGNRCSAPRVVINLFLVWLLTGIWHGANWTFIIWGLLYFLIIIIERTTGIENKKTGAIGHIYTLLLVGLAWVIFRADNTGEAIVYIKALFGNAQMGLMDSATLAYIKESIPYYFLAIIGCTDYYKRLCRQFEDNKGFVICRNIMTAIGLLISLTYIVNNAYSPFIYFNF